MLLIWNLFFSSWCLLILGSTDADPDNTSNYKACETESIRTGGPGEVAYITSPDDDKQNDCKLHITTCAHCMLELTVIELDMSPCQYQLPPLEQGCAAQCDDFISVHEPSYFSSTTSYIVNSSLSYQYATQTHVLYVQFCLSSKAVFKLRYVVKEKIQLFNRRLPGYFTSPSFPSGYQPSGDRYKYVINNTGGGYIRLQFTDWNLANESKITIYHSYENSSYKVTRFGSGSRPFIKSQGSVLVVVFETGPENSRLTYLGFRAEYRFTTARDWPNKPYNYDCGAHFTVEWGGHFSLRTDSCPDGNVIDCVWVLYRYPLPAYSDYIWLSIYDLKLEAGDVLEIRSGNNSQGAILKTDKEITSTPSEVTELDAIYIHLRVTCRSDRIFKASYVSYDNAQMRDQSYYCPYRLHFACKNQRCIHKSLICDGINHCGDWSDEQGCHNPGNLCNSCLDGQGWYCADVRCDGRSDCLDGSDEKDCIPGGTSHRPPVIESNHYYWGTITPVVLISLILGIITCIVISYYIRRKRLLRERGRCLTRTQTHATGRNNVLVESLGLSPGIYGIAPPTYEEALIAQYIPSQGTVNTAFEGPLDLPAQPPPYSPKCDVQLPIQYLPPYVATQPPASAITEPGGSHSEPCISSQAEGEARLVMPDEGRLNSEVCEADSRNVSLVAADQDSSGGAVPYVSEDGADMETRQTDNNLASSQNPEAPRTDVGAIQAVLAGRGALTGIVDNQAAASTASGALSPTTFVGDESVPHTPDAVTPSISEQLPASKPQRQQQQDDDAFCVNYFGRQGADNAAFESCSLHDEPESVNSDASIPDNCQHQFDDHEQDDGCRFLSCDRTPSGYNVDNGTAESNCSQSAANTQQSDNIGEYISKSYVTIEESGDVFV